MKVDGVVAVLAPDLRQRAELGVGAGGLHAARTHRGRWAASGTSTSWTQSTTPSTTTSSPTSAIVPSLLH